MGEFTKIDELSNYGYLLEFNGVRSKFSFPLKFECAPLSITTRVVVERGGWTKVMGGKGHVNIRS